VSVALAGAVDSRARPAAERRHKGVAQWVTRVVSPLRGLAIQSSRFPMPHGMG
jgi:hypothetical protein